MNSWITHRSERVDSVWALENFSKNICFRHTSSFEPVIVAVYKPVQWGSAWIASHQEKLFDFYILLCHKQLFVSASLSILSPSDCWPRSGQALTRRYVGVWLHVHHRCRGLESHHRNITEAITAAMSMDNIKLCNRGGCSSPRCWQ